MKDLYTGITVIPDERGMTDTITLKGDRELWIRFVARVKQRRKKVWQILEPFLKSYIRKGK